VGQNGVRCKLESPPSTNSNGAIVNVFCHSGAAAAASSFVVKYGRRLAGSTSGAYVFANSPTAASYSPSQPATINWNSTGVLNRITKTGTGTYTVTLPRLGTVTNATPEVTAIGTGSEHCKVASWAASGADMNVNVRCYSNGGTFANVMFMLNFVVLPGQSRHGARALAQYQTSASYTPSLSYNSTSSAATEGAGTLQANRSSAGTYSMTYNSLTEANGVPFVGARGDDNTFCKIADWNLVTAPLRTRVSVLCLGSWGATDTQYVITHFMGAALQ
jgi:hypothetical protein